VGKAIDFKPGDSIKFGPEWCANCGLEELAGKTIMMQPHLFDYDDDMGGGWEEAPGMMLEGWSDPESIFHLFGNNLDEMMDCEHIKGGAQEKAAYQKVIDDRRKQQDEWHSRLDGFA